MRLIQSARFLIHFNSGVITNVIRLHFFTTGKRTHINRHCYPSTNVTNEPRMRTYATSNIKTSIDKRFKMKKSGNKKILS